MVNTHLALKVAFCNEMYDLCEKLGTNYYEVRDMWLLDPRTTKSHTAVFTGERGFGGKCFPKDTNAFTRFARNTGSPLKLLEKAIDINKELRNEIKE